jgi:hypothetical protein
MKQIDPQVHTGMLACHIDECAAKARMVGADALHPAISTIRDELPQDFRGKPVRAWILSDEPFFGDGRKLPDTDYTRYRAYGVTDIITNVPERYLT